MENTGSGAGACDDLFNLDLDSNSLFGEGDDNDNLLTTTPSASSSGHQRDASYSAALTAAADLDLDLTGFGFETSSNNNNNTNGTTTTGDQVVVEEQQQKQQTTQEDGDAAILLSSTSLLPASTSPPRPSSNTTDNTITNTTNNNSTNADDDVPPQLIVSKSSGTLIYRSARAVDMMGIKVIQQNQLQKNPPQKLLRHEETVSKLLPPHVHKRQVIEVGTFHGHPALYFKWENGITCQEWLEKVTTQSTTTTTTTQQSQTTTMVIRLRAAVAIAKTLQQFHQCRIVYNALTLENIVLTPFEGDYLATFIDLSDALICCNSGGGDDTDEQTALFEEKKGVDLVNLGIVLNQLFRTTGEGGGGDDSYDASAAAIASASASGRDGGGEFTSYSSSSSKRQEVGTDDTDGTDTGGEASSFDDDTTTNTNTRNVRNKRGKQLTPGEGLPLYLRAMVSTLLVGNDETNNDASQLRYESANDVYEDLKVMMTTQATNNNSHHNRQNSNNNNNNSWFKEIEVDQDVTVNSRLKLPKGSFYGRKVQMSMIMHLLQSATMLGDRPLMGLVTGYPGTGKSTLVKQIKKPLLANANGFFIEGKFDKSTRPDKVLASALDSFFADITASSSSNVGENYSNGVLGENACMSMLLRWRISDAVGSGVGCLYDSIPSLRKFMDDGTEEVDNGSQQQGRKITGNLLDQRLKYMFCKLISAIPCSSHTLVLVLDDLQWADEMTLGVIRMLMTDPEIHHFLFLGCYRDNEVNDKHMLSSNLKDIREQGINVVTIKVGAMEKESTNALLSDVMCLPPNLCRPLSNVVHQKTGGVIMFILRLLASLNDEGLIWYSINTRRWMFNLEKIELKEMSEDVVKHMTQHMSRLSGKMQLGLKLCACLGPSFDATTLERARKDSVIGDDFLESCVEDGFLQTGEGSSYKWSHNQVQQAAYGLIPLQRREKIHLLIGSRLLLATAPSEMDRFIFHITDNINRGAKLLKIPEQKYEVVELNLRAGEKMRQQQSFHSAVKYLMTGIELLGDDSWRAKYRLSLRLYDAAAEALCVVGDYSTLTVLADKPLRFARCFGDKLITYSNLVRALSSSGNNHECINTSVSVLSQLGEFIPAQVTHEIYFEEVTKVRQALIGLSREDLLSLPVMSDFNKLTAMRFLNHMLIVTYASNPPLNPIVVFRMVRLTVDFGVCKIAAIAFSCYGAWLASSLNEDYESAFTMGRVASDLVTKMGSAEMLPRVHAVVYGMINIYKEPWQASLCKHSEAFDAGLIHGDMEYAVSNIVFYHTLALCGCGSNLEESSQSLHKHIQRGVQYNQKGQVKTMAVLQQMTFDLMGVEKNAYFSHFGGLNENAVIEFTIKHKLTVYTRTIYQKIRYVKYMCGDMDGAAVYYDLLQDLYANCAGQATNGRSVLFLITTFIDGLIGAYFARKHLMDEAKWTCVAQASITLMSKWAKSCTWNFANKLSLLQAEYFFLKNDGRAYACYKASIRQAREHRFNHEEGLAHEKFATYLLFINKHDEALQHFQDAKKCYAIWHAHVLVQRVEKAIEVLSPLCSDSR